MTKMSCARISARERCSARVWQRVHQGAKAESSRREDFLYWLKACLRREQRGAPRWGPRAPALARLP